jgi:RES domain-containing protein
MRVFRTAPPHWANTKAELFGGNGAAENPGRWNFAGEHTTYCTESLEGALAEAGYYEIIFHLHQLRGGGIAAHHKYHGRLLHRLRRLVVAEFNNIDSHLVDISTADQFEAQCKRNRIRLKFEESRYSDYPLLNDRTRRLAQSIRSSGAAGIITRSARSEGRCVVIFPRQAPSDVSIDITKQADILLSASSGDGIWDGKDIRQISEGEIHAIHTLEGARTEELIQVLSLS